MNFIVAAQTDVGLVKKTNQDCFSVKCAKTEKNGNILFGIVCDGMGGLAKGELASASVVRAFVSWFENSLPVLIEKNVIDFETIKKEWSNIINTMNSKIGNYGIDHGISLGTTLVCVLCINNRLYVANVGDSRLYKVSSKVSRLTKDHSLVAHEIELGNLSPEEEETDSRRNVLLQCIGASTVVNPEFEDYSAEIGSVYILCSDGFRHKINDKEILGLLSPKVISSDNDLNSTLIGIINLLKERNETDNISAVSFKIV